MPSEHDDYWKATRHPSACVLFVLPMLALYEAGLLLAPAVAPDQLRNGADIWLRSLLSEIGISAGYGAPCLLVAVLLIWLLWTRQGWPGDHLGVWIGMAAESAAYAVLLLALSQGLWHVLLQADHVLGQPSQRIAMLQMPTQPGNAVPEPMWGQLVSYLGAGIYEETLFRLVLFGGLLRLLTWPEAKPAPLGVGLAAFASALLFAGAHHLGPHGDPFNAYVLSFRTFAGLFFAWLFQFRGFGIAVGAHAGYDVLVGLILQRA